MRAASIAAKMIILRAMKRMLLFQCVSLRVSAGRDGQRTKEPATSACRTARMIMPTAQKQAAALQASFSVMRRMQRNFHRLPFACPRVHAVEGGENTKERVKSVKWTERRMVRFARRRTRAATRATAAQILVSRVMRRGTSMQCVFLQANAATGGTKSRGRAQ